MSRPPAMRALGRLTTWTVVLLTLVTASGCGLAKRAAVAVVYDRAELPAENVSADLPYRSDGDPKHRFDLFLPLADSVRARPWPTVVFVHGGGWTEGDRAYAFGGADVYGNIGRFFAGHGIGAAVVSYRLQPQVDWRAQVDDVAAAVAAVRDTVVARGGAPQLVLMGHSAGSHLSLRVALSREAQARAGIPEGAVCGAMPVSGAALDLRDRESFVIGDNYDYYLARFAPPGTPMTNTPPAQAAPWQAEASVVPLVTPDDPPTLLLYAGGDYPALIRQNTLLADALRAAGVPTEVVVVPGKSHFRIVPTLSRDDQTAGPAMLAFVRALDCGG